MNNNEKKCSKCKRFEPLSAFAHENRQTPYAVCETCREAVKNHQERNRLEMNDLFFRYMQTTRLGTLVEWHLKQEKEDHPEVVEKMLRIARAHNKISAYAAAVKERIGETRLQKCQGFARDGCLEINHLPRNGVRFSDAFKAFYHAVKDGEPYEELLVDLLHADRIDPCSKEEHAKITKKERQENAKGWATFVERHGRWRAQFRVNNENKYVGYYCTRQQARGAARAARASFISTGHYENPPRRKQNALAVVEGPEGSEDWRVYKGKELISKFATEQEARADLERRYIRRYFN